MFIYVRACVWVCVVTQRLPNLRSSGFCVEKSVVKIPVHRSAVTSRLYFSFFPQTLHTNGGIDHFLLQYSDCLFSSDVPFGLRIFAASDSGGQHTVTVLQCQSRCACSVYHCEEALQSRQQRGHCWFKHWLFYGGESVKQWNEVSTAVKFRIVFV